jgi:hypothetical protein
MDFKKAIRLTVEKYNPASHYFFRGECGFCLVKKEFNGDEIRCDGCLVLQDCIDFRRWRNNKTRLVDWYRTRWYVYNACQEIFKRYYW